MPRGFLVKRTRKPGPVSYRIREDNEEDVSQMSSPNSFASVITSTWMQQERPRPAFPAAALGNELPATGGGVAEAACAPAYSPGRPVGTLQNGQNSMDRAMNSSSPVQAESFPANLAAFSSLSHRLAFLPSYADMESRLVSICTMVQSSKRPADTSAGGIDPKPKVQAKRPKSEKKSYRDEVTTSPVLGLRIREDPEDAKHRGQASSPLGGFVCQLCREQYTDPLSLAQHKCSRIVRVEYRCTECDKVFSCPANLASHRRWHKPRSPPPEEQQQPPCQPENAKENQSPGPVKREVATPSPQPSDSDEELYDCSHCNKKFRRQAYLRKHLALHNRSSTTATVTNVLSESQALTNVLYASQGIASMRDLQRPMPRDEPLALVFKEAVAMAGYNRTPSSCHAQGVQAHPCRFCPETLFSSAGLTRHINRCHPSETRQVILLQVPQQA